MVTINSGFTKRNIYFHKDFLIRCKIVEVYTSGKCLLRNKQGFTFISEIKNITRLY